LINQKKFHNLLTPLSTKILLSSSPDDRYVEQPATYATEQEILKSITEIHCNISRYFRFF